MGPLVCHPQKIFWPPFPKYIGLFPCQCREISQHLTDFWPPFFFFRFLLFQFLLFFLFSHTHEFFLDLSILHFSIFLFSHTQGMNCCPWFTETSQCCGPYYDWIYETSSCFGLDIHNCKSMTKIVRSS